MNIWPIVLPAIALLLPTPALAQQYSIDWYRIAGGGGKSTAGIYSLSGTIGQSEAAGWIGNNGRFFLGGFWALQTPGAPTLKMEAATAGQATISWEPKLPGWILQERADLTSGSWTNSPSGTTNPISVPTTGAARFYRLYKP